MNHTADETETTQEEPVGDGLAALIGTIAGAAGGLVLGVLIILMTTQTWSITSTVIVLHAILAMIAMGAWITPSLMSHPGDEEQGVAYLPIDSSHE